MTYVILTLHTWVCNYIKFILYIRLKLKIVRIKSLLTVFKYKLLLGGYRYIIIHYI